jgi:DNA invertase Pin-like site-specific DNA recombinase
MTLTSNKEDVMSEVKKVIAYLRVSMADQDTEKNEADILKFANNKAFGTVNFVEEKVSGKVSWKKRKIKSIIDDLGNGDKLIVPDLSRLGRSALEIFEMLAVAKDKGIAVYDVKNEIELNDSIHSQILAFAFGIDAQIERDLISKRTIEALAAKKAMGVKLGRPKGPGKSKLDPYREEIIAFLKTGSTQKYIAKKYGVTPPTFYNWLNKNGLHGIEPQY